MAVLSTSQTAIIQQVIDLLQGNRDLPLDAVVVEQLARVFEGKFGLLCGCGSAGPTFRDSLRDAPITTLLQLLVAVSDAGTGPDGV